MDLVVRVLGQPAVRLASAGQDLHLTGILGPGPALASALTANSARQPLFTQTRTRH